MLSQSTRMPRPAASPPDAGHPTQSQVCSVNLSGCQDRWQVLQTPGIQPRVRYAQSINPDAKTGGKSSRCLASNPVSGMLSQSTQMPRPVASPPDAGHPTQSQVCSVDHPGCHDRWQVLQTQDIQTRIRYAQLINPDAKTVAGPPDAGHPTQSQVCTVNQPRRQGWRQVLQMPGVQPRVRYAQSVNPDAKTGGRSSRRRASNSESGMLSQSTQRPRRVAGPTDAGHPTQSQVHICSQDQREVSYPYCSDILFLAI
jgi:hypothetical protein